MNRESSSQVAAIKLDLLDAAYFSVVEKLSSVKSATRQVNLTTKTWLTYENRESRRPRQLTRLEEIPSKGG
jgi:hypothetical protein